jgi:hypothetical protein
MFPSVWQRWPRFSGISRLGLAKDNLLRLHSYCAGSGQTSHAFIGTCSSRPLQRMSWRQAVTIGTFSYKPRCDAGAVRALDDLSISGPTILPFGCAGVTAGPRACRCEPAGSFSNISACANIYNAWCRVVPENQRPKDLSTGATRHEKLERWSRSLRLPICLVHMTRWLKAGFDQKVRAT